MESHEKELAFSAQEIVSILYKEKENIKSLVTIAIINDQITVRVSDKMPLSDLNVLRTVLNLSVDQKFRAIDSKNGNP